MPIDLIDRDLGILNSEPQLVEIKTCHALCPQIHMPDRDWRVNSSQVHIKPLAGKVIRGDQRRLICKPSLRRVTEL
jgi:hypothetical protein